jgi:Asp-tRNA(Asn)/Glu-tRNA(Gln) amidotransferase B subunit
VSYPWYLQSHPQAEVVALCGRRYDYARSLADRFNIHDVCADYHEFCTRPDLDAVTIVTSCVDHAKQAIAALESGKHVFCEKPMAATVADANAMVRAADASKKIHQMAFSGKYADLWLENQDAAGHLENEITDALESVENSFCDVHDLDDYLFLKALFSYALSRFDIDDLEDVFHLFSEDIERKRSPEER